MRSLKAALEARKVENFQVFKKYVEQFKRNVVARCQALRRTHSDEEREYYKKMVLAVSSCLKL